MDGKTKMFKDGNPEVFRWFTEATLKNMTKQEKAKWTEYSDDTPAPIPKEVIDFEKQHEDLAVAAKGAADATKKLADAEKRVKELEEENKGLKAEINTLKGAKVSKETETTEKEAPAPTDEDAEKKLLQEELQRLGVKFAYNSGIPKLKEKLAQAQSNANDPK